jgi:hypothetical protein
MRPAQNAEAYQINGLTTSLFSHWFPTLRTLVGRI